ncbi:MAG: CusA/CzcA family heavy metal efflux RND transporter [Planctomycetes bacterium]|nr:CusA/CzcA family heavy metal efflux RND transporter [Planctomycetota bacterium]
MTAVFRFAMRQRLLVILLTAIMAALGVWNFTRLPIDAVPDLTNVQVQINTAVPGLSPMEVERQITFPVERVMGGIPHVEEVRSLSRFGLSQVTIIFEDGTDIYFARQLVNERLLEAKENLPPGLAEPRMGPIATGLGEIYLWTVEAHGPKPDGSPYSLTDLRSIQDWIINPQMKTVPGVNEINSIGGYEKQYVVLPDPSKLAAYRLSFQDLLSRLAENNANVGGGYIEHADEQYLIRSTGLVKTLDDIRSIVLASKDGVPILVTDVAEVALGRELRQGAATANGTETVVGTAIMLIGENSRTVSQRVHERLAQVNKTLPPNVEARTVYDRTYLVDATLRTVRNNLMEGALLVIVVLLLLLGNIRAAIIVASAIPLSMLFAISGMVETRTSANLMSLGAIDFGLIVDGAVVMVENILRRLGIAQEHRGRALTGTERTQTVLEASKEVARPTLFGVGIIMIVYLPILTLTSMEGKMFRPMAGVLLLALTGALILAMTFVPAMCSLLLRGKVAERENLVTRAIKRLYGPTLLFCLHHRKFVVLAAIGFVVISSMIASRLGSEFVPRLREGAFALEVRRIPSVAVTMSVNMQKRLERALVDNFPDEIDLVSARLGTAEIAMDPMGPNTADTLIMLKPREQWTRASSYDELAQKIQDVLDDLPGDSYEFSQPIELRVNELVAGVRSELAVKIFGDDLTELLGHARQVAEVLERVPGAWNVRVEQVTGLPILEIDIDRQAIARHGLNISDVQKIVATALGGSSAGDVFEADARFALVVRLPEQIRSDIDEIGRLLIPLPERASEAVTPREAPESARGAPERPAPAGYVPLSAVARIERREGANMINRENGKRRVVVTCNTQGRDIGSFVSDAQRRIEKAIQLPSGYWLTWGGQFENMIAARKRLTVVVPVALFLIFIMLFSTFGSIRLATLVFLTVPLALTGGVVSLWLRGMPFSITAGVGFIALSGVAVLNGLVMVSFIRDLIRSGIPVQRAVRRGSMTRLRPVLMTAMVASLGFVPMAVATSMGAEVQRPLATVVIGGLISSTLLTLVVLPTIYEWFHGKGLDVASNGYPQETSLES